MRTVLPLAWLVAAQLAACGGETVETTAQDATNEAPNDSSAVDASPADTRVDTTVPETDSATVDSGGGGDTTSDVVVPETGTTLTAACSAKGGVLCTNFRWNICPAGFEPVSSTDHLGCGTADGWCCRVAPPSPCAASGKGNCLPSCPIECWQPVTDPTLTCDGTKTCCRDVCK